MPGFPQPFTSSVSHWQATNRGPDTLWNHGSKDELPTDVVDYVIVGGGLTGSSLAYHLTLPGAAGDGKKVVLLEAKDLASGATGRNGGNLAPWFTTSYPALIKPLSSGGAGLTPEEALATMSNELETLEYVTELGRSGVLRTDIDLWRGKACSIATTEEEAKRLRDHLKIFEKACCESERFKGWKVDEQLIDDPQEAKRISRVPSAIAVIIKNVGSCHPHKFTTALVRKALKSATSDFIYFSWAPVKSISDNPNQEGGYLVDCHERGKIRAKEVIVCTNAYTKYLFPQSKKSDSGNEISISDHIMPYRGHCAHVIPPISYSGSTTLKMTYVVEDAPYCMTTPHTSIVTGIGGLTSVKHGLTTLDKIYEQDDDSVVFDTFGKYYNNFFEETFDNWGPVAKDEGVSRVWTGIMASSRDKMPLIGKIPNKTGLYAAVAFHGHGMSRILTCTRSLASQIQNNGEWDKRLPRAYEITKERLERAKEAPWPYKRDEYEVRVEDKVDPNEN